MISIANPELGDEEKRRVERVLESGMLAEGEEVRAFEREFADYCEADHGVATSNGTTALHAALEGLDIGAGDRVLTTPFSFAASANAIRLAGAEPVFADIDPETYTLDPDAARAVADEADVDAILVVHLYGLPAEMDAFVDLAAELDAALIEDAAQAHGATYDGRPVGTFGDAACFSFYPTKNMTTGEGGMVLTDREDVKRGVERFINHGRPADGESRGYDHVEVGHNFRMTNLAAAIGRAQLERLPAFVAARRENAARLTAGLEGTAVETPVVPSAAEHAYHQYTIRADDRDALREHLASENVASSVYYPTPLHKLPAFDGVDDGTAEAARGSGVDRELPEAERAAAEVLSVPVHPKLTASDVDRITGVIDDFVN